MDKSSKCIGGWKCSEISICKSDFQDNLIIFDLLNVLSRKTLKKGQSKYNTRQVKKSFVDVGTNGDYLCYSNGLGKYKCHSPKLFQNKEWLFDLIWYKEVGPYTISELSLAMECEWSGYRLARIKNIRYAPVKYDFQKLIVCSAKIKVMIFQEREYGLSDWDEYVDQQLAAYKTKDAFSLLCIAYSLSMKSFKYKVWEKDEN